MKRNICIHGHFYQPPRENAWLEDVELQDSAFPYHDWNERITNEGYAPNTASRILDHERHIIDMINNYARISFNVGPTLLSWLEDKMPHVYEAILEADKESQKYYSGHGSAIAQVYNHMIMPLANRRDKETQVIWGIKDFEKRFGRKPEGMWLSETAVDTETLEILARHGIKFTILAPYQAHKVRKIGEKNWHDVTGGTVDPRRPYRCHLDDDLSIDLFFYDGPISQEIGFGNLLDNGENFANRLLGVLDDGQEPQLVHIATDGETYGHHHKYGEMALSYCLYHIESNDLANITIYAEYLEKNPPKWEAKIYDNTSWSCFHGVERWRANCGCNSGMHGGWHQEWRKPLREALDWLREKLIPIYERQAGQLLHDPWQARNDYIDVILDRSPKNVKTFFSHYQLQDFDHSNHIKALRLLELQRHAMLMYTSCGWFFDEISGIETTQIMQYAARALQLLQEITGDSFEDEFQQKLAAAPSNLPELGNGAVVYEKYVKPSRLDLLRVGAHYAVSSLFEEYKETTQAYCYSIERKSFQEFRAGKLRCIVGRVMVHSHITWEESDISFAVLYLGGHILNGGARAYMGLSAFTAMRDEIKEAFNKSDIPDVIRAMDEHFGTHSYTLWHLFKGERRKVFDQILESSLRDIEVHFRQIFENEYAVMHAMREMQIPLPKALSTPVEFILNADIKRFLESNETHLDNLKQIIDEFSLINVSIEAPIISFVAGQRINELMRELDENWQDSERLGFIFSLLETLEPLRLDLDLWEAQNKYFMIGKRHYEEMKKKKDQGAKDWVFQFKRLGERIGVKVS